MSRSPSPPDPPRIRSIIGRRLATGFGLVAVTALAMCTVLLVLLADVASSVRSMRAGEVTVRDSLGLAMAVREQYIHQAHTIIEGNHSHIGHYEDWVARASRHAQALRADVPERERPQVEMVAAKSRELDRLFRTEMIPALDRGDTESLTRIHRRAEKLSSQAASDADALALGAEARMSELHGEAIDASRTGVLTGTGCMLVVIALGVLYTFRIRRSVTRPLEKLARAANRFGRGDFEHSVGHIGEGEFEAVARACDAMLEELRARETRVVEAERLAVVGQIATGVAHEINNPIGVIRGYLKTMSPDGPRDELAAELRILDDEAQACQRIADDLLSYARVNELQPASLAVDELINETVRRFRESGEGGGRAIEVDVQPGRIVGDTGRLRQVILNLIRNASEASPLEGKLEITGKPCNAGGYTFSVLDQGRGVDTTDTQRIFEPFFSKRDGGSGLGLAVCHGIVSGHGGTIRVEPRPAGGSEFRVTLPKQPLPTDPS